jgi:predicted nicotinamide N-methyase
VESYFVCLSVCLSVQPSDFLFTVTTTTKIQFDVQQKTMKNVIKRRATTSSERAPLSSWSCLFVPKMMGVIWFLGLVIIVTLHSVSDAFIMEHRHQPSPLHINEQRYGGLSRLKSSSVSINDTATDKSEEEGKEHGSAMQSQSQTRTRTQLHNVNGVICREVVNYDLPLIDTITVVEATAESQEELVDEVLLEEEEKESFLEESRRSGGDPTTTTRIHNGDPYGAVLWPASWAVANYLLQEEQDRRRRKAEKQCDTIHNAEEEEDEEEDDFSALFSNLHVVEIGTGTGLVSLALAKAGAKRVVATDYEPLALQLTEYAERELLRRPSSSLSQSHEYGSDIVSIETQLFDLCDVATPIPTLSTTTTRRRRKRNNSPQQLVVAADIMYEPSTGRAMARRVVEALQEYNCRVVVGDSPGRAGRPAFLEELQALGVPSQYCQFQDVVGRTCVGPRHDLICGDGSVSVSRPCNDVDDDQGKHQELSVSILDLIPSILLDR